MTQISVKDAAKQLDRLAQLARQGEDGVLTEADQQSARIVSVQANTPVATRKRRQAGTGRGVFIVAPDFDAPLDEFTEYT